MGFTFSLPQGSSVNWSWFRHWQQEGVISLHPKTIHKATVCSWDLLIKNELGGWGESVLQINLFAARDLLSPSCSAFLVQGPLWGWLRAWDNPSWGTPGPPQHRNCIIRDKETHLA